MPAVRNSKVKTRAKSPSGLDKVMSAVVQAANSLSSIVKDNIKAAEIYVTGDRRKAQSAKPKRKRQAAAG